MSVYYAKGKLEAWVGTTWFAQLFLLLPVFVVVHGGDPHDPRQCLPFFGWMAGTAFVAFGFYLFGCCWIERKSANA